jgi:hypothetical protein
MRSFLFVCLAATFLLVFAPNAEACQKCKIDNYGCQVCRELDYNGAQDCVLVNGEYCQLRNGSCEGSWGEEGCGGSPPGACVYEIWAANSPHVSHQQEWRLVRVTITPAKRVTTAHS